MAYIYVDSIENWYRTLEKTSESRQVRISLVTNKGASRSAAVERLLPFVARTGLALKVGNRSCEACPLWGGMKQAPWFGYFRRLDEPVTVCLPLGGHRPRQRGFLPTMHSRARPLEEHGRLQPLRVPPRAAS